MQELTGQVLYKLYVLALEKQDVGCDAWAELDETDQTAWELVASLVELKSA